MSSTVAPDLDFERERSGRLRAEERLAVYDAVTSILSDAANVAQATPRLLAAVCRALGCAAGLLWRVDDARDALHYVDMWSREPLPEFAAASRPATFQPGRGLPGRVWATARPAWVENVAVDANLHRGPVADRAGLRSAFAFPVMVEGKVHGVMEFFHEAPLAQDDALLTMMATVGAHVGHFIAQRRAEAVLHASEQRHRTILSAAVDAIVTIGADDSIVEFNPAAERMFGYARQEAIGSKLASLVIPERLRDRHMAGMARYLRTELPVVLGRRIELPARRANGEEFPAEIVILRVDVPGPPLFTGFIRDVTDARRAADLLAGAPVPIFVTRGAELVLAFANVRARALVGATLGAPLATLIPAWTQEQAAAFARVHATGDRVVLRGFAAGTVDLVLGPVRDATAEGGAPPAGVCAFGIGD